MVGFIIGILILSLWLGIVVGCCYCGWINQVREVTLMRNWPFMRVVRRNQNLITVRAPRQVRNRRESRNRNRNHQVAQGNREDVEQGVLAIE